MAYPKIEGERLDVALLRLRQRGEGSSLPPVEEFEALLSRPADKAMAEGSMESLLVDFIMPIIKDVGVLHEPRAIRTLIYLRDHLHQLLNEQEHRQGQRQDADQGGGEEEGQQQPASWIVDVKEFLNDLIARYTDLNERRHENIAV
jgi:hypothetical protein